VQSLFAGGAFSDFGPDHLHPAPQPHRIHLVEGPGNALLRSRVHEQGPREPGVYGMIDRHGDLIYVGKAKSLRTRLLSYFRPRSRDPKASRILQHTAAIAWEVGPSEFAALHRELELIRRWRPRFNVLGQPSAWRHTHVCVGRSPAPYVFLARRPPAKAVASFGPVTAGGRAREAVRRLNDWFRLRDCSQAQEMVFAEQVELFPVERTPGCLRHEIGTCLGPCAAACSRGEYAAEVAAARAFLAGTDTALLDRLRRDMHAASAAQQYERAAGLRDRFEVLRWLHEQLQALRDARSKGSFVYPVAGHAGRCIWYLIDGGRTVAAVAEPAREEEGRQVRGLLEEVYRPEKAGAWAEGGERVEGVLLVAGWFSRYPEERQRVLRVEEAIARCS
jgi:excinuclease ABC subunit C